MKIAKHVLTFLFLIFLFNKSLYAEEPSIKWKDYKSTHFIIYYNSAPESFIYNLSEKAEDYYNKIAEDLGFMRYNFWLWDNRAQIYIYDNAEQYQSATGMPAWSLGVVTPQKKIINSFLHKEDFVEVILPHELGHIIFREFVGFDNYAVPLWLDEGVASYQQKTKFRGSKSFIKKAIKDGSFMNIAALSDFKLLATKDRNAIDLFYIESVNLVDYLIKEYGRENFVTFCQSLRDKKDINRALASAYPFGNTDELNETWQKYLTK